MALDKDLDIKLSIAAAGLWKYILTSMPLHGNIYEVDPDLSSKKITLRFDPFDLSLIQVWYEGKRFADATVLDLTRPALERVKKTEELAPTTSGLNFFDLAEQKRRLALPPFSYSPKEVPHA